MRELTNYTKLKPELRVNKTDEFIKLLNNPEHKVYEKKIKDKTIEKITGPSAKEKTEKYGIEILPVDKNFKAYYKISRISSKTK